MSQPIRIKICGITEPSEGEAAARLGADAVGINFYEPSPRFVEPARVNLILNSLPGQVEPVGVFVHQYLDHGLNLIKTFSRFRTIQWHGENREPTAPGNLQLILAFPVRDTQDLRDIDFFLGKAKGQGWQPAAILVDAHVPGIPGGTGQTAPWNLLEDYRPEVPLILAGGLTPDNVAEAIRIVRPNAVDVAGGVESAPGRKDMEKVRRFISNAREAAHKYIGHC
jgi:phosphoribosylanthranilate isomerase